MLASDPCQLLTAASVLDVWSVYPPLRYRLNDTTTTTASA